MRKLSLPRRIMYVAILACYQVLESKWIHLNGGDAGMVRSFKRVHKTLVPGGAFVVEAQPHESYNKARKLHPTLQENAQTLQQQPEVICSMNSRQVQRLGEPSEGYQNPFWANSFN